jgi:hypothetical protein
MDNIFEASLSQKESTLITAAIIRNAVEKIREKETPCIYRGKESVKAYNDGLEFAANFLSNIANEMVCSSSYSSMRPLTPTRDDLNALWCSYGVAEMVIMKETFLNMHMQFYSFGENHQFSVIHLKTRFTKIPTF